MIAGACEAEVSIKGSLRSISEGEERMRVACVVAIRFYLTRPSRGLSQRVFFVCVCVQAPVICSKIIKFYAVTASYSARMMFVF